MAIFYSYVKLAVGTGWWFGTCFIFPYILGRTILLTDFHISQRGRVQPQTSLLLVMLGPAQAQTQRFQSQFAGRLVEKEYLCLCEAESTVAQWGHAAGAGRAGITKEVGQELRSTWVCPEETYHKMIESHVSMVLF